MVIAHNILAMNAQRQFGINDKSLKKNTERLSSGYRINRSADDAAGLAISEKMRRQIRGLTQASDNCQDGVSFNQVADGAMNEVADMLHRMNELSVQAANGTNTETDREYIQQEIDQLITEIDRVTETTEFNTLPVFGRERTKTEYSASVGGSQTITSSDSYMITDINYGLVEVVGKDHIYGGNKLDDQLAFSGSGWHSTGKTLYYSRGEGSVSASDLVSKLVDFAGSGNTNAATIQNYLNSGTMVNAELYSDATHMGKIYVNYDGRKDLDGNLVPTSITIQKGTYKNGDKSTFQSTEEKSYSLRSDTITSVGYNNGKNYGSTWIDFSGLGTDYSLQDLYGQGFNTKCATCSKPYSIYFSGTGSAYEFNDNASSPMVTVNISGCNTGEDIVKAIIDAVDHCYGFENHYQQYAYNDSDKAKLYIYDNRNYESDGGTSRFEPAARDEKNQLIIGDTVIHNPGSGDVKTTYKNKDIWIQSGADAGNGFYIKRANISASILGIDCANVRTPESAGESIDAIKSAMTILNTERSMVGAQQNRCEYAIKIDDNIVENTTAAESAIRDTDMAEEMVEYSNRNILAQAGQAMLAQANQANQGVLSLLG